MKKIFTKLIGVTLGLAMAVGVGVGVAANNRKATGLNADDPTRSINSFSSVTDTTTGVDSILYASYQGGGTTAPAISSSKIRLYQNNGGDEKLGGYVIFYMKDSAKITGFTASFGATNEKVRYGVSETNKGSSAVAGDFVATNYSVSTSNDMEVTGLNTTYLLIGNFRKTGSNSTQRADLASITLSYSTGGGEQPTTYTVTYDANGGTGTMTDPNSPYSEGATVTVLENEFTRDGFDFVDFTTAANGSGQHYDKDDTFTINANTTLYAQWEEQPSPYAWVFTPIESLLSSDEFAIVGNNGNNYAMSNNNGTTSAPSAVAVTVNNGRLSGAVADTIKWNISGNKNDGYTFYPNGSEETWLYSTDTNNGMRVGTNANKTFVISEEGYLKHVGTSRYVGVYNSADWRAYGSAGGNIANQTFGSYRKVQNRTLSDIVLSGEYQTTFTQGDTFSHEGLVVTAQFEGGSSEDVSARAIFTGYNFENSGQQTVTVSYTEGSVVATKTYNITVNSATLYSVTGTITNGSISSSESVREGNALNITISAIAKYDRPASLTVTMGGNALSLNEGYTYDSSNGAFSIASVTGDVAITGVCEKTHGLWAEAPYSIAEAKYAIDNSGTVSNVYVKGVISQVDSFDDGYKSITYWISEDGSTENQFEVYSGKGFNGASFTGKDDVRVGAIVVIKGTIKKYNDIYEFNYNNQLVFYSGAILHATETDGVINSVSIIFNIKVLKSLWNSYGTATEYGMMLFKSDKATPSTVEAKYNSNPAKVLIVNEEDGLSLDDEGDYYSMTVEVQNVKSTEYARKFCVAPYLVSNDKHHFLSEMVWSVNSLADKGVYDTDLSQTALDALKG